MAILHTLIEHRSQHGNLRSELLNPLLNDLGDLCNLRHVLVSEHLQVLVDTALSVTDGLLELLGVDAKEVVIEPRNHVILPSIDAGPQLEEGCELSLHLFDVLIHRLFEACKTLILVVLFGLIRSCGQLILQGSRLTCYIWVRVEVKVLIKCRNLVL